MAATALADGHLGQVPEMSQDASGIKVTLPDSADASISRYHAQTADMDGVQQAQTETAERLASLSTEVDEISSQMTDVNDAISQMSETTGNIATAKFDISEAKGVAAQISVSQTNTYNQQRVNIANYMSTLDRDVDKMIADAIQGLETDITNGKKNIAKTLEKLKQTEELGNQIKAESSKISDALAAHEECAKNNQIYIASKKACGNANIPSASFIPKVYNHVFNNADGRDRGYINNRVMKFEKMSDESYLRIFYYDNLRVHGHTAHGRWHVQVCDANGNGCAECRNPGRLNAWRWSSHQHNWWMNDHVGHVISGLCKATSNRQLKKGKYVMKIYLDNNRYDMYTGHNQAGNFMVDEVMKY